MTLSVFVKLFGVEYWLSIMSVSTITIPLLREIKYSSMALTSRENVALVYIVHISRYPQSSFTLASFFFKLKEFFFISIATQ